MAVNFLPEFEGTFRELFEDSDSEKELEGFDLENLDTESDDEINFFQDHTKIILCPLMAAATYIDEKRHFQTYRMNLIEQYGCSKDLASRLRYARTMVERLLSTKSSSSRARSAVH